MVILEEVNLPHPWCPMCNMMVSWRDLNGVHWRTVKCKKGAEKNRKCLAEKEERSVTFRDFSAYGRPLDMVTSFKYLERLISAADDDWPDVVRNLDKVRAVWRRLKNIHQGGGGTAGIRIFI